MFNTRVYEEVYTESFINYFMDIGPSVKCVGYYAMGCIDRGIYACLIGRQDIAFPLFRKSLEWIDFAIESKEKWAGVFFRYQADLYGAKAIAEWLLGIESGNTEWNNARIAEEDGWTKDFTIASAWDIKTFRLEKYMAYCCLSATDIPAVLEAYKHWTGKFRAASLARKLSPHGYGFAVCRHLGGVQKFTEEDLFLAGTKMLSENMEGKWLGSTGGLTAIMWLKIVYSFSDKNLTPLEVLWKAYEHMPNVEKPLFMDNNDKSILSTIMAIFSK
jgi:hypothetical protein